MLRWQHELAGHDPHVEHRVKPRDGRTTGRPVSSGLPEDSYEEKTLTTHLYDGLPAVTAGEDSPQSPGIPEISVRIRHLIAILDECLIGPAESSDDLSALAWIVQSLEDIEATITGLAHNQQVTNGDHLPPVPVYQLTDQGSILIA